MSNTAKVAIRREQIQDHLEAPLSYAPGVEATQDNELPTKKYVDEHGGGQMIVHDLAGVWHQGQLGQGQHGTLADGDHTGPLSGNARVAIRKFGTQIGIRRALNLKEGPNIHITAVDNPNDEAVDITISATGSSSSVYHREDLSDQANGATNAFVTSFDYEPGTLELWMNGLYQGLVPKHFVEQPPNKLVFLDWTPQPGEEIVVRYAIAGAGAGYGREDLSGQINGGTITFTTSANFAPGTLELWMNGLYQGLAPKHFVEHPPDKFTFLDWVPQPGEEITVRYALAGGGLLNSNENSTISSLSKTNTTDYVVTGALPFDPTVFPGKTIRFVAVASVETGGIPATVQLLNYTENREVCALELTSPTPVRLESDPLLLSSGSRIYMVRIKTSNPNSQIVLYGSLFEIR